MTGSLIGNFCNFVCVVDMFGCLPQHAQREILLKAAGRFCQLKFQGSRDGEVIRAPASQVLLWPGLDSLTWRHMWVEFVVGSCLCSKSFSLGSSVFLPPQKPTFQIPVQQETVDKEPPCGYATAKFYLYNYLFILLKFYQADMLKLLFTPLFDNVFREM